MKKMVLCLLIFSFLGCSSNDEKDNTGANFLGKWKLTETYISDGATASWIVITDGYEIDVKNDGSFVSSKFDNTCLGGTYTIENSKLILNYACNFEYSPLESTTESTNNVLLLSNPMCDETCLEKFERIE